MYSMSVCLFSSFFFVFGSLGAGLSDTGSEWRLFVRKLQMEGVWRTRGGDATRMRSTSIMFLLLSFREKQHLFPFSEMSGAVVGCLTAYAIRFDEYARDDGHICCVRWHPVMLSLAGGGWPPQAPHARNRVAEPNNSMRDAENSLGI